MSTLPGRSSTPEVTAALVKGTAGFGLPVFVWALVALLNLAAQVAFRRHLEPGDFAVFNAVLSAIGLTAVPLMALRQGLTFYRAPDALLQAQVDEAWLPLQQNALVLWGFVCALVFLPVIQFLGLPRFSISLFATTEMFVMLGACFGLARYQSLRRWKSWGALALAAALARVLGAIFMAGAEPWAEMALVVEIVAGAFLLAPVFRQTKMTFAWGKVWVAWINRDLRLYLAATFSVMLAIFLFTSADRFLSQIWFGRSSDNNLGLVRWGLFDGYQTAGLLARSLVWGAQPILFYFLARRSRDVHTGKDSRRMIWIYLFALLVGAVLLYALRHPLAMLFGGGSEDMTEYFLPGFTVTMVMMGLVQGVGFFALASRRYPECFTLGAAGVGYTVFLALVGRPQLLVSYMFGGGAVALLLVLFIGVVRWGRRQP